VPLEKAQKGDTPYIPYKKEEPAAAPAAPALAQKGNNKTSNVTAKVASNTTTSANVT